jgi:hypothetical protein
MEMGTEGMEIEFRHLGKQEQGCGWLFLSPLSKRFL